MTEAFEEAFDELYRRAFRLTRRLLGDTAAAEDIAAEALARAYARWPRVSGLHYRDAWVLRVAANLAVDRLRRAPPSPDPCPPVDPEESIALRMALSSALSALPRRQRQAVALRYLGELSAGEVAVALGISQGSVKTHIHRGLAALRKTMGRRLEAVVPNGLER